MTYIHRENIETLQNVKLPYYFDDEVKDILKNLDRSLHSIIDKNVVKSEENQSHRAKYVDRSWHYYLPRRITIGNTYNMSPFSSISHTNIQTNVYHGSGDKRSNRRKEKQNQDNTALLALVGFVSVLILGTSCYYLGKSIGESNGAAQDVEDAAKLKGFIERTKKQIKNAKKDNLTIKKQESLEIQMEQLKNIASSKKIFLKIETDASRDLKLRVSLAVGAIILGVGALLASNAVMIAGGAVLTFTACLMLIKAGCGSDKARLTQEINKMRSNIVAILKAMENISTEKGKGVPFFRKAESEAMGG